MLSLIMNAENQKKMTEWSVRHVAEAHDNIWARTTYNAVAPATPKRAAIHNDEDLCLSVQGPPQARLVYYIRGRQISPSVPA